MNLRVRTARGRIAFALGVVYLLWGSTYLGIRIAIETVPPLLMAGIRLSIAGAILYAFAVRRGDRVGDRPGRAQWGAAFIVGAALLLGGNGAVVSAENIGVPSGVVALLVGMTPLWMALITRIFEHQRLPAQAIAGLVVGFAGTAFLVVPAGGSRVPVGGALLVVGGALSWAAGSVYVKHARLPHRPLVSTGMEMLAGGVLLLGASALTGEWGRVEAAAISWRSVAAIVYLIVFGSIIAFSAYVWLLGAARISLVSTYAYVNPVVAVFLGWILANEEVTARTLIAGAVIIAAVALIVGAKHPDVASPADAPPPHEEARER